MRRSLLLGVMCSLWAIDLPADTIFNNATNDLAVRFDPGPLEIGDEIVLSGNARYLTNFAFEYWGTNSAGGKRFGGNVQARVRFYRNDGPMVEGYPAPGSRLWASCWFSVDATERSVLLFSAGSDFPATGFYLPSSRFTWSVQFRGLGPTDHAGVDFYSPPVTGGYYPDYWENNNGVWTLRTNLCAADFAALLEATLIPEPAVPPLQLQVVTNLAVLSWPGWATNFLPEVSGWVAGSSEWIPVTNGCSWVDNNFVLCTNVRPGAAFFRLRKL
jgi:hypothetical protein